MQEDQRTDTYERKIKKMDTNVLLKRNRQMLRR